MQASYWALFGLSLAGVILSLIFLLVLIILLKKHIWGIKYFVGCMVPIVLVAIASIYMCVPCIKDYNFVKNNTFREENLTAVEFTYVRGDPDGNGKTEYSAPKFYVKDKNEYIVLNIRDVEIGKTYRIRFLPNTGICEILYCIE